MPCVELVIPVERGEIWAEDTGGDATPLVLMHPGWGDSSIWDAMMARDPVEPEATGIYSFSRGA
jgi:pimeloyl-ACP methyl ester carboxylesterase